MAHPLASEISAAFEAGLAAPWGAATPVDGGALGAAWMRGQCVARETHDYGFSEITETEFMSIVTRHRRARSALSEGDILREVWAV